MNIRTHHALALAALSLVAATAAAQSVPASPWYVVVGVNKIMPKVESGEVTPPGLPGSTAGVSNDTKPILNIGYNYNDHVSVQLDLGVPYTSDFYGTGALQGSGKIGQADVLPPTLFAFYRFLQPSALLRPYVGVGVGYAYFRKETGSGQLTALLNPGGPDTTFRLKNKWTSNVQIGTTVTINPRWFVDIGAIKTWLDTKATYSTGQTQDIKLNPVSFYAGVGYHF